MEINKQYSGMLEKILDTRKNTNTRKILILILILENTNTRKY